MKRWCQLYDLWFNSSKHAVQLQYSDTYRLIRMSKQTWQRPSPRWDNIQCRLPTSWAVQVHRSCKRAVLYSLRPQQALGLEDQTNRCKLNSAMLDAPMRRYHLQINEMLKQCRERNTCEFEIACIMTCGELVFYWVEWLFHCFSMWGFTVVFSYSFLRVRNASTIKTLFFACFVILSTHSLPMKHEKNILKFAHALKIKYDGCLVV